ncbi:hypothetical protein ACWGI0_23080 [Streptomyces sp. NPDC054802]
MNPLATLLGMSAYWLLGAAYISWRSQRTGMDFTPMGILRNLDQRAAERPDVARLPLLLVLGVVAAAFVVVLTLWPALALRRLAIHLGIMEETRDDARS